jgi:ssDNA-binding Zn-finger/Zn-ribbon topoisomerase 1
MTDTNNTKQSSITRAELIEAMMKVTIDDPEDKAPLMALMERLQSGEPFDLDDTKQWLKKNYEGTGCKCPACGKHVQLKDRTITSAMAKALIAISKHQGEVNISELKEIRGGDYAKLRYWGLIEEVRSGRWQITHKGRQFVHDKVRVPKVAWVYNKRARSFNEEETINIREALGKPSLYQELMQ